MLLRGYPEAASIVGGGADAASIVGGGADAVFVVDNDEDEDDEWEKEEEVGGVEIVVVYRKTPYQMDVDKNLPPYYLRLLLRAAPDLNPAELHRLNYAERRMAMFLAFRARTYATEPPFLARLRFAKMDLVKHVISFL